jgi:flagellar motor component MotA
MCFGPVLIACALLTPSKEGRKAVIRSLCGIGLSAIPLMFFSLASMNGISSSAVINFLAVVIIIGCIRLAFIVTIQVNANKSFEREVAQLSVRKK